MYDEIKEEIKTVPTKSISAKSNLKKFCILLAFFNYHSIIDNC